MLTRAMFIMLIASAAVFLHGCSEGSQGSPEDEPSSHEYIQGNKTNVQASTAKQPQPTQVVSPKAGEAAEEAMAGGARNNQNGAEARTNCEFHESVNDDDDDVIAKCDVTRGYSSAGDALSDITISTEVAVAPVGEIGNLDNVNLRDIMNLNRKANITINIVNSTMTFPRTINGVTYNYRVHFYGTNGIDGFVKKTIKSVSETITTTTTVNRDALGYCNSAAIERDIDGCLELEANWSGCQEVNSKCKTRHFPEPARCVSKTPVHNTPPQYTLKCGDTHYRCDCPEYIPRSFWQGM